MNVDLSVRLAPNNPRGLDLKNPVMTASGTFGYGTEDSHLFDIRKLGAIVCKGTFLKPRDGNPQPRIAETPSGMLNSIGMEGIGIEALIREKAPVWAGWDVPVIVNIAGETVEEYAQIAERLDNVDGVSGIEVNISCPNIQAGGAEFGIRPDTAAAATAAVRKSTSLPVLVKLTPNSSEITAVAEAVAGEGADTLTLINTLKGMAIDIYSRKPILGNVTGGLSGPAIKPVALYMVYEVSKTVNIPIIGCGGISTAADALEFIMAGATAVQVGTVGFSNPSAPMEILEGIEDFMTKKQINSIEEIIGAAR
ncbi:MAG: dihydroorotate dehydrogenase [Dehalococcoidales bacterium]|nr:MAG: dihydroorotate dehydrogenase [Dehalococcoidales bacterium]